MSRMLTQDEMASLSRGLARRTRGRLRVGPELITADQGIAIWNAAATFEEESSALAAILSCLPRQRRRADVRGRDGITLQRQLGTGAGLALLASLAGCASFGGNIKGDFACRAPDGICAPTSKIDDAALAAISGDTSMVPTGPYYAPSPQGSRIPATAMKEPVRSGEKVLRIVFPAHIDPAGRFREATAIHAVVDPGDWMSAAKSKAAAQQVSVNMASPSASAVLGYETSSGVPGRVVSLGDLASAAPEMQFPSPVADLDAQNAAADAQASSETQSQTQIDEAGSAAPVKPKRVSARARARAAKLVLRNSMPVSSLAATSAAPVHHAAAGAPAAAVPHASSNMSAAPLPAASGAKTADPIVAIKARVAQQLSKTPAGKAGAAQTAGLGSRSLAPAALSQSGAPAPVQTLGVAGVGYSMPSGEASAASKPAGPVNAPSMFPASEVNK